MGDKKSKEVSTFGKAKTTTTSPFSSTSLDELFSFESAKSCCLSSSGTSNNSLSSRGRAAGRPATSSRQRQQQKHKRQLKSKTGSGRKLLHNHNQSDKAQNHSTNQNATANNDNFKIPAGIKHVMIQSATDDHDDDLLPSTTRQLGCNKTRTGSHRIKEPRKIVRKFRKLDITELTGSPAPDVKIGQRVAYKEYYGNEFGTIRWIGRVPQISPDWTVGVEFDNAIGEGDGSLNGRRYFIAKDCFAKFLPLDSIACVEQHVGRPEPGTMISVMSAASRPGQMISIQRVSTVHVQHCFLNAPHRRPGPEIPLLAVNSRLHCQCPSCGPCAHVIKPPRTQRLARPTKNATHMCQFSTYTCCGMQSQEETLCNYQGNRVTNAPVPPMHDFQNQHQGDQQAYHSSATTMTAPLPLMGNSWIAGSGYLSTLQAQQMKSMPDEYKVAPGPDNDYAFNYNKLQKSFAKSSNDAAKHNSNSNDYAKSTRPLANLACESPSQGQVARMMLLREKSISSLSYRDLQASKFKQHRSPASASTGRAALISDSLLIDSTSTTTTQTSFIEKQNAATINAETNNNIENHDDYQFGMAGSDIPIPIASGEIDVVDQDAFSDNLLFADGGEPIDSTLEADLERLSQARYGPMRSSIESSPGIWSRKHQHHHRNHKSHHHHSNATTTTTTTTATTLTTTNGDDNRFASGKNYHLQQANSRNQQGNLLKTIRSLLSCLSIHQNQHHNRRHNHHHHHHRHRRHSTDAESNTDSILSETDSYPALWQAGSYDGIGAGGYGHGEQQAEIVDGGRLWGQQEMSEDQRQASKLYANYDAISADRFGDAFEQVAPASNNDAEKTSTNQNANQLVQDGGVGDQQPALSSSDCGFSSGSQNSSPIKAYASDGGPAGVELMAASQLQQPASADDDNNNNNEQLADKIYMSIAAKLVKMISGNALEPEKLEKLGQILNGDGEQHQRPASSLFNETSSDEPNSDSKQQKLDEMVADIIKSMLSLPPSDQSDHHSQTNGSLGLSKRLEEQVTH